MSSAAIFVGALRVKITNHIIEGTYQIHFIPVYKLSLEKCLYVYPICK